MEVRVSKMGARVRKNVNFIGVRVSKNIFSFLFLSRCCIDIEHHNYLFEFESSMATTYFDSVSESNRKMTRSGRGSYLPLHLRNDGGVVASFNNLMAIPSNFLSQYGHHFDGSRPKQFNQASRFIHVGQGHLRGGSSRWVSSTKA